jgi:hypothetical protein
MKKKVTIEVEINTDKKGRQICEGCRFREVGEFVDGLAGNYTTYVCKLLDDQCVGINCDPEPKPSPTNCPLRG